MRERSGLGQSTVSRHVARLVADGLVESVENPKRRREHLCTLTPAGRRLLAELGKYLCNRE